MHYWLVLLVTGLFLACSTCYWLVPWLFRLLLTCSLVVPLVTGLFRLFRALVTSYQSQRDMHQIALAYQHLGDPLGGMPYMQFLSTYMSRTLLLLKGHVDFCLPSKPLQILFKIYWPLLQNSQVDASCRRSVPFLELSVAPRH